MIRRALAAGIAVGALAAPATAAAADTALNVVPWGQHQPGAAWASQPGVLPAPTQALMYDRLTPLFRDVTDAHLAPSADGSGYFKSEALLREDDPSLLTLEQAEGHVPGRGGAPLTARVRRDAYGVPHVYSDTDDGVIFGAGWVTAADRNLLLAAARDNAYVATVDVPGVSAAALILGGGQFTPSAALKARVERTQTRAARRAGRDGRRLLRDIDTYLAGANAWLAANSPSTPPLTRADLYALNAFKGQFLGEGGGSEVANALALAELEKALGRRTGRRAYEDLRQRNDRDTDVTTERRFPLQTGVRVAGARGRVPLSAGSFEPVEGAAASAAATAGRPRPEASNALLVGARRSASGRPIMVAGPQLPYTYPGFTLEMGLYGPSIRTRGVTSAPFPGYMLIGRGERTAWSLTSAGVDIIDTYAERLCGGSDMRYRFKGRCRRMTTLDAGTLTTGDGTRQITLRETVHGPVTGYARDRAGRRVAMARKRSSAGRDVLDQLFFQRLTYGKATSAKRFLAAARKTPQTFNAFYVSAREIAFVTTGRFPIRPKGVNPDLPVDGRGAFEWRGFARPGQHPQAINPRTGWLVNWNNKPARDFPAGDGRWSEGSIQRNELLTGELERTARHTPATVTAAMNAAATQDVRIVELWPVLKAVLDHGSAPSARAAAMVAQLQAWHDAGGSRLDRDLDGTIDAPGAAVLDGSWERLARAAMCGRLGEAGCAALETRMRLFDAPAGGQYAGWHQYMDKDLRRLLGRKLRRPLHLRYCGNGSLERCAADLWAALDAGGAEIAGAQGDSPAAWRRPAERVSFQPLPLVEIRYTNRPSGIQQIIEFGR